MPRSRTEPPAPHRTPTQSLADVALSLAARQRSERTFSGKITDANAKGIVQVEVEWHSPDPDDAAIASNLYDVLRAKYPLPVPLREGQK